MRGSASHAATAACATCAAALGAAVRARHDAEVLSAAACGAALLQAMGPPAARERNGQHKGRLQHGHADPAPVSRAPAQT